VWFSVAQIESFSCIVLILVVQCTRVVSYEVPIGTVKELLVLLLIAYASLAQFHLVFDAH